MAKAVKDQRVASQSGMTKATTRGSAWTNIAGQVVQKRRVMAAMSRSAIRSPMAR